MTTISMNQCLTEPENIECTHRYCFIKNDNKLFIGYFMTLKCSIALHKACVICGHPQCHRQNSMGQNYGPKLLMNMWKQNVILLVIFIIW